MKGWNRCDDCGKFRHPEHLERGEHKEIRFGVLFEDDWQVCKDGYGCKESLSRRDVAILGGDPSL